MPAEFVPTNRCSLPQFSPIGTWKVAVWVEDFEWYGQEQELGLHSTLPFEVVAGPG